ncbi:D-serine ammonia-lyase [Campylobacter geochelonis]|uniref:Probable D-serine dehydratase n=1 Tax=Campylobacter geochelonis TaxID=1780362 RepID=A0A128EGG6_9BACT|nr:D-serine ammonia-lyase [Campylobacter geochelonis]QKF71795.1 D-serine ammonia-lyase [Campylobacter geochelonis]CZE47502.1 D-serine dehydratase [Campylobacter geochelonis]CZE49365.1 D-serine dehydratase [Campylobacter geochelonis]CZE51452.1 D-serine dehydratase [Campylobacter geochelonis]
MDKIIENLKAKEETLWINPKNAKVNNDEFSKDDIEDARARLDRFAPLLEELFPASRKQRGILESPLVATYELQNKLEKYYATPLFGKLWFKLDSHLPISGSIKARGGIYEVLKHTEDLLIKANLLSLNDNYKKIANDEIKQYLSNFQVAVGSTGNLGLSIGIMSAKLGFKASVHMSSDAREWKKAMLRSYGVNVVEYDSDYSVAVAQGRKEAQNDSNCYFVDDENSKSLFLGYAVAARRLAGQLKSFDIKVDSKNPLFVYLPCGVGGGPGGVAYGLKQEFGEHVHCFFAEPTHSPCMLLGMHTGKHDKISVFDIGLDNKTAADGLAVGRASSLVGKVMDGMLEGIYTISDDEMYRLLYLANKCEGLRLEPSALAGAKGVVHINKLYDSKALENATHIAWITGGSMVPDEEMDKYIQTGKELM